MRKDRNGIAITRYTTKYLTVYRFSSNKSQALNTIPVYRPASIQGPPCIFAPHIFCPTDCNLNFPALFGLAAVITIPCGCVNWKSRQNLGYFKDDDEFRVRSKNHYASPSRPWSKMREAMLNNCLLLLFFVKKLWFMVILNIYTNEFFCYYLLKPSVLYVLVLPRKLMPWSKNEEGYVE